MELEVKKLTEAELDAAVEIWNQVVEDGEAFPQVETLDREAGRAFFAGQSYTGVAVDAGSGAVVGLYILHPNNVGRCGHICNASYAVRRDSRGRGVGEALVRDCLAQGRRLGFRILQFNAVVAGNRPALALYRKMGFTRLGVVPKGFRKKDGAYEDIVLLYREV